MLTLKIEQDTDPLPPDELGGDVESGFYLTTTRNNYFSRNPELLEDEDERAACWNFPLYMYAHSGVALSLSPFSCPWDSGQVGFVRVHKAKATWLKTEEEARKSAEYHVECWNQYLSGDVWGYVIEDSETGEEVDSCWGFYGEEYAKEEGKRALGAMIC